MGLRRHLGPALVALATSGLVGSVAPARAQAPDGTTRFLVDAYQPAALPGLDVLDVARSRVPPHLGLAVGLELGWVGEVLEVATEVNARDETARPVDHRARGDLGIALGLFERLAVAVGLPFELTQGGDDLALLGRPGATAGGGALGDLRVSVRGRLLSGGGLGFAAELELDLPTGDAERFMSYGAARLRPRLVADWHDRASGFGLAANVGWHVVPERRVQNLVLDDGFDWAVGLDMPSPVRGVHVEASLFGTVPVATDRDPAAPATARDDGRGAPLELLMALSGHLGDVVLELGGGAGLSRGIGAPAWRMLASVAWAPAEPIVLDSDKDGLPDPRDACPTEAEDKDGFEDGDGCPDPDDDGDGVLDVFDRCPRDPEDKDECQDEDGCPDPDNDDDGIRDTADRCPSEAEDKDGVEDDDGCADPDNDGDGVPDVVDGPPEASGFGSCRDAPETKNGYRDEDGCPDEAPKSVRVTRTRIEILDKVFFDTNKATIKAQSFPLLDEVARVLREAPEITKVRVDGHTDWVGDLAYNDKLSQARAESVVAYLVEHGVAAERLEAKGWGKRQPIITGPAGMREPGAGMNRRVEFLILEVDGKPQDPEAPVIIERPTPVTPP